MSFQALLFCPDERTARVVSQVLADLDFKAECCSEPFLAVKRLMAQRYDAIVVECENEQNASLVLKSARNSQNNQNALTVAVVEGQSGVANAFRIGANLVLTKPIAVEQAKSTLRVARGLLRKSDAPRPAAPAAPAAPTTVAAAPPVPQLPKPAPASRVETVMPPPLPAAPTVSVTPAASTFLETEKEPEPTPEAGEAALLESINHVIPTPQPAPAATEVPMQAEPHPVVPPEVAPRPVALPGRPLKPAANPGIAAGASSGAGLAAAPAKELVRPSSPKPPSPVRTQAPEEEILLADPSENVTYPHREEPIAAPVFGSYQQEAPSRSRKPLVAVLVVIVLAGSGYAGWVRLKPRLLGGRSAAAATPVSVSTPAVSIAPGPQSRPLDTQLRPSPEITPDTTNAGAVQAAPEPPADTATNSKPSASKSAYEPPEVVTIPAAEPPAPAPKPLQVKTELQRAPQVHPQEPMPLPSPNSVASSTSADLAGIVDTPTVIPTVAPQQTVRVSQGVSQGLLIRRVQPVYPQQAMQMRLQGTVVLQAVISKQGVIKDVKAISGEPLLSRAAIDAVRQWKYNPYYLNGEPVDIQTQISVVFRLP
jgi:protein TonB